MDIDIFQVLDVGFPPEKTEEVRQAYLTLYEDFLPRLKYSEEIPRLEIVSHIYEKKHYVYVPKPRFAKARICPSTVSGWPDQHYPPRLQFKVFVDMDAVRGASGAALRHALIDPVCAKLLDTPKTVQKRIDIPSLIADLNSWADGNLLKR